VKRKEEKILDFTLFKTPWEVEILIQEKNLSKTSKGRKWGVERFRGIWRRIGSTLLGWGQFHR
ncbi:unnamed protein product, partial [Musa textilis]